MRLALLTALVAALVSTTTTRAADIRAKTADGREVLLKDNGTWSYVESTPEAKAGASVIKDKDATLAYKGKRETFAIHLRPDTWKQAAKPANLVAEVMFIHKDGEIYAMVIAERFSMPLEALKNAALANMRAVDKGAKILVEESRKINGVDVLCVTSDVTANGIPMTFHSYYYAGEAGTIQVVTWTGRNLFAESKPVMESFLNGLVILKK